MAGNKKHHAYTGGAVTLALTVPAGSKNGDVLALGADGLFGWLDTEPVTQAQYDKGEYPQGYVVGQAGVYLPGITLTLNVDATQIAAVLQFGKVYIKPDRTYTGTAAGATLVGYKLGKNFIGLKSN
jgi:hypothetical protein